MGLGGGFILTIYNKATGLAESLIARESAPAAAHQDMFENVTYITGALSVAVPGELKGYAELHSRYGRLPWSRLIQPSIDLAENGFEISPFLGTTMQARREILLGSPEFRAICTDPVTGELLKEGETMRRPKLAATLRTIAAEGADALYSGNGSLAKALVQEMEQIGGIITMQDLVDYRVRWERPQTGRLFGDRTMYTSPLPGTGSVLVFIMNFLNGFLPNERSTLFYHRLLESFKFGFAMRTKLADRYYVAEAEEVERNLTNRQYAEDIRQRQHSDASTSQDYRFYGANYAGVEDHGTAHVSVLAPNGDAVAVTSTVNTL